jgi:hypothetical protein
MFCSVVLTDGRYNNRLAKGNGVNFPESDWKLLRSLHRAALERYCARVLDECAVVMRDDKLSAHDRYLRLVRLVRERDDRIAAAFDDLRRSTAIQRLAGLINLGLVSSVELEQFTLATRESATGLAEIFARRKNPKAG